MLKKLLGTKINETTLLIFFGISLFLVLLQTLFSIYVTNTQMSNVEKAASKKGIMVITENGTQQYRKIYENDTDTAFTLSLEVFKKMFGFDYKTIDENLNYIRIFLSTNAYNSYERIIKGDLKSTQILKGNYKIYPNKIKMEKDGQNFITHMIFKRKYYTNETEESTDYYVKITTAKSNPTELNLIGFFITNFSISAADSDQAKAIFKPKGQ